MQRKRARRHFRGPLRESKHDRGLRAGRVLRALRKAYPDVHVPLEYSSPLELLIATILSAQCTDARVNEVTSGLFPRYRTAGDWAAIPLPKLEKLIRSTGFFRNKARAIHEATEDIVERFEGRVPDTLDELTSLRGVGRKSANVVLAHAFDTPGIIVDTHFRRITRRLGMTREYDPVRIEFDLMEYVPRKDWSEFSLLVTWHGRETCTARKPACGDCPIARECPAASSDGQVMWKVKEPGGRS
ncbi:MAG: endonuclease III [Candidatus Eisenbacteria bacterium]|nr:endonuclease III [Candidatus Eisenbacteria bacterium]